MKKQDTHQRQRTQSGVLTELEVARIKLLYKQGRTPRELMEFFPVSLWALRAIKKGDTWNWVEPEDPTLTQIPVGNDPAMAEAAAASLKSYMEKYGAGPTTEQQSVLERFGEEVNKTAAMTEAAERALFLLKGR